MYYRTGLNRDRTHDTDAGDKKSKAQIKQAGVHPIESALLHQKKTGAVAPLVESADAIATGGRVARFVTAPFLVRPQALPA